MSRFRQVSKEEFDAWIAAYPRPLIRHLCTIISPEPLQFCDEALGVWPEFVVAYFQTWGCDPADMWAQVPGNWHVSEVQP